VSDITVLKGRPLKELDLRGCTELQDLSCLVECRELERLAVPAHCTDIEFLRELPNPRIIDTKVQGWDRTSQPAAQFWRKWDAKKGQGR